MVTVSPTNSDVRWGPEQWQVFDYYANPTRISTGNPLLIITPPTGWSTRSHQSMRDSAISELWYFTRFLLGGSDVSGAHLAATPGTAWDICAPCTGQQKHDSSVISRSKSLYGMDVIRDEQAMICAIKALHGTYGFNPSKIIRAGSSATAVNAAIAQLAPARLGSGGGKTWFDSYMDRGTFDSSVRGVIFSEGPVDLRDGYMHYTRIAALLGVYGVAGDDTEYLAVPAAVKSALSLLAYIENGDLGSYPGIYALFRPAGDGVHPLGELAHTGSDPHDSSQLDDLRSAALTAGISLPCTLVPDGIWTNTGYPTTVSARSLALYQAIETWMRGQIT